MTEVAEKDTTETEAADEAATDSTATDAAASDVTPPAEGTAKAKKQRVAKTYKERLDGAFEKENIVHNAFIAMVERETGFAPDLKSIIAVFTLYNDWRASKAEDYTKAKEAADAAKPAKPQKADKAPKTVAEADAAETALRSKLAELEKVRAQLMANESGEGDDSDGDADGEVSEVETTADTATAKNDEPPF